RLAGRERSLLGERRPQAELERSQDAEVEDEPHRRDALLALVPQEEREIVLTGRCGDTRLQREVSLGRDRRRLPGRALPAAAAHRQVGDEPAAVHLDDLRAAADALL